MWATQSADSASGRQYTTGKMLYPLWKFKLPYEVIRDQVGAADLATLVGFINARRGRLDDFLYLDPGDNTATAQAFGTGDGTTKTFQLLRTYGGVNEPIGGCNTGTAVIYVNGTPTAVTFDSSQSIVTFATVPSVAAALTWSGTFYFRCRFTNDAQTFKNMMQGLWNNGGIEFRTFKQ